ncbi:hypothetical protein ACBR40_45550 [Nonomuraea sp. AD125B]|uniref:hypothetical protein n=1 Tax=Nonomuraea sp. AD125B TaxID=3242897 RepID=UPI0035287432
MTITSPPPDDNPFPGADKREWTDRLSTALAAEMNLPLHITNAIAAYFVHPKDLLTKPRGDSRYWLRPEAITREGSLKILNGTVHGFAGSPSEYNERIRSAFHSPVRPGADPLLMLPALETGHLAGRPAPFLTTSPVTPNHLASLLETMESALDQADGDRGYRLAEDVATHGQQTQTLHVPLVRRIHEEGSGDAGERSVVDLMSIRGANRSRARLTLHGLKARDIVFGIRPQEMLRNKNKQDGAWLDDPISADPYYWVPILADLLREIYADPGHSEHEAVRRAARVATVPFQLVIGADDLSSFHNAVFDPNRVDHRRPPLDYGLADKAASDVRALLRELTTAGRLTEANRAWLAGEGPDPSPRPGESPVDARDRRDIALFNAVFPEDTADRALVREVIGEPAPYATGRRHVENRTRMISAVISDGYSQRWNPRVLDGLLPAGAIKNGGFRASPDSWSTLLERAEKGDSDALETFLVTRGIHWLAEHKIVEADRGSMGAQAQDGTEGEKNAPRIRRGGVNVRAALLLAPVRAIALMRELAHATNTGALPRQIDEQGCPIPGTVATRTWFDADDVFPKTGTRRPKKPTPSPEPGDAPAQPDPTPQELVLRALTDFQAVVALGLPTQVAGAIQAARELHDKATGAGLPAFPVNVADTVIPVLIDALNALRTDVKGLSTLLIALQGGTADIDDFNSACMTYLNRAADQ